MSKASDDEPLRVGQLAARAGVSPRMLRHYENEGILAAWRSPSGQRMFEADALGRVRAIRDLLDAGLPIRVIRELVDCVQEPGRLEPCALPTLVEHLRTHDARMAELAQTRSALQGLIDAAE